MKKIVFFNTKGGTGKTTICYNYGWYLAEKRNKRVLFLDFDPQANLFQAFHIKLAIREGKNLENLIVNCVKKQETNFKDYVIKVSSNIDLLPSSNNISLIEEYLTDLKKIITNLEGKFSVKVNIAAVIINAYEKRRITSENISAKFVNKYSETFNIINQKIRYLSHYQLSISLNRQPVFISFPSSEASLDLLNAFNEVDKLVDDIES